MGPDQPASQRGSVTAAGHWSHYTQIGSEGKCGLEYSLLCIITHGHFSKHIHGEAATCSGTISGHTT